MKNSNLPTVETRIRRLLAVGCPVPADNHSSRAPDLVLEVRNPERNQAFDFRFKTEYIFDVRITNNSFARLKVENLEGLPPWKDQNFTWLVDPQICRSEQNEYKMPSGRTFPYQSVLNHRICKMELEPGESYDGMLLAWSPQTRIPTDYLHGESFPMRLALVDQFGRSHLSIIELRVDRHATMIVPQLNDKSSGTGLYEPISATTERGVSGGDNLHSTQRQPASFLRQ